MVKLINCFGLAFDAFTLSVCVPHNTHLSTAHHMNKSHDIVSCEKKPYT